MYKYTKINGNGNNFLILDNRKLKLTDEEKSALAQRDCNVKTSIGADGILFVEESEREDFTMRIFNLDGSEANMCGNGARCIAKYAYDKNIAKENMTFETKAGIMKATVAKDEISLDMGIIDMSTLKIQESLEIQQRQISYSYLLLGVPHAIIYCEDNNIKTKEEILDLGQKLSRLYSVFPEGTNVNFVKVKDKNSIEVLTYERGVYDLTNSCGTGSCASAIISAIAKNLSKDIKVTNLGGINHVKFEFSNDKMLCHVILSGKVQNVAEIQTLL